MQLFLWKNAIALNAEFDQYSESTESFGFSFSHFWGNTSWTNFMSLESISFFFFRSRWMPLLRSWPRSQNSTELQGVIGSGALLMALPRCWGWKYCFMTLGKKISLVHITEGGKKRHSRAFKKEKEKKKRCLVFGLFFESLSLKSVCGTKRFMICF